MRMQLSNGFAYPTPRDQDAEQMELMIAEAHSRVLNIGGVRCVLYGTDLTVKFHDEAWAETAQRRTGWARAANDENALVAMLNCRDGAHAQVIAANHAWSHFEVCSSGT